MRCPVCHQEMMVVEREGIELDYCMAQEGLWFDAAELELLLEAEQGQVDSLDCSAMVNVLSFHWQVIQNHSHNETIRKCSHCKSKMEKAWIEGCQSVIIDRCPKGHGLWFDQGELEHLINWVKEKSKLTCEPVSQTVLEQKVLEYVGSSVS